MLKNRLKDLWQVKKLPRLPHRSLVNTMGFFHSRPVHFEAGVFKLFNTPKPHIFNFKPSHQVLSYQQRFSSSYVLKEYNWQIILNKLRTNDPSVTQIYYDEGYIGDAEVQELFEALEVNRTLRILVLEPPLLCDVGHCPRYSIINDISALKLAKALKANQTLHFLDISCNEVSDAGARGLAEALKMNQTLQSLHLKDNKINDEGAEALAEALKLNRTLQSLVIASNGKISDVGAKALAEALKVNQALQSLDIASNEKISHVGAQALATALKVNRALQSLDIGDHEEIGDVGAQALAEALKVNQSLQSLSLWNNEIGTAGAQALAEALKANQTLQELNLNTNKIDTAGAQALAEALKTNQTLLSLSIGGNEFGDTGVEALAEALKVNQTLQELNIHSKKFGDTGAQALAEALKVNQTLQKLIIGPEIGDAGTSAILHALTNNYTLLEFGYLYNDETSRKFIARNQQIKKCLAPIETFEKTGALDNRVIVSAITVLQSLVGNLNETHVIAENQRLLNALKYLSVDDGAEVLSLLEKPFNDRRLQSIAAQVQEQTLRLCNGVIFKL